MNRCFFEGLKWIALDLNHLIVMDNNGIEIYQYNELELDSMNNLLHNGKRILDIKNNRLIKFFKDKKTDAVGKLNYHGVVSSEGNNLWLFHEYHVSQVYIKHGSPRDEFLTIQFYKYKDVRIEDTRLIVNGVEFIINDSFDFEIIRDVVFKRKINE
jgi:hypothetical protein